jgi:hypothetical protein
MAARPKSFWGNNVMWDDPIVAEVHRIREQLAAKFDFDLKAIFADLRNRQSALGARLVPQKRRTPAGPPDSKPPESTPAVEH